MSADARPTVSVVRAVVPTAHCPTWPVSPSTPASSRFQQCYRCRVCGLSIPQRFLCYRPASTVIANSRWAGASGAITIRSGNTTGGSSLSSGNVTIKSGDGSGTNTSSGNVSIDSGSTSGSGTAGTITVGGASASALSLNVTGVARHQRRFPDRYPGNQRQWRSYGGWGTEPGPKRRQRHVYPDIQQQHQQYNSGYLEYSPTPTARPALLPSMAAAGYWLAQPVVTTLLMALASRMLLP